MLSWPLFRRVARRFGLRHGRALRDAGADLKPLSWSWLADIEAIDAEEERQRAAAERKYEIERRKAEARAANARPGKR